MSTPTPPPTLSVPDFRHRYSLGPRLRSTPIVNVWTAHDRLLNCDVTLTLLRDELADDPAAARLMKASTAAARNLDHPGIARIVNVGESDRDGHIAPWAAGEPVAGPNVDQLERPADLDDHAWALLVLGVAEQLARAVQHAHAAGVVHGNLGPATVLLTGRDRRHPVVKLVDFGPQPTELLVPGDPELTTQMSRLFARSLEYPSPEQKKSAPADRRSDIFGFGCVLATLLLSSPEPADDDAGSMVARLRRIAKTAMKKHPSERQRSFLVVLEELGHVRARPEDLHERADATAPTGTSGKRTRS